MFKLIMENHMPLLSAQDQGKLSCLSIAIKNNDQRMERQIIQIVLDWAQHIKLKDSEHGLDQLYKIINILRPFSTNLKTITEIYEQPLVEIIYENLLWVSPAVEDGYLDETKIMIRDSSVPDTSFLIKDAVGIAERVRYRVSAPTEYLLGQTELTDLVELWKDTQS